MTAQHREPMTELQKSFSDALAALMDGFMTMGLDPKLVYKETLACAGMWRRALEAKGATAEDIAKLNGEALAIVDHCWNSLVANAGKGRTRS